MGNKLYLTSVLESSISSKGVCSPTKTRFHAYVRTGSLTIVRTLHRITPCGSKSFKTNFNRLRRSFPFGSIREQRVQYCNGMANRKIQQALHESTRVPHQFLMLYSLPRFMNHHHATQNRGKLLRLARIRAIRKIIAIKSPTPVEGGCWRSSTKTRQIPGQNPF